VGNHVTLIGTITDTGIGISSESQELLFKPFTQADNSMLRKFGGTGLGLFITKQLCEKMGGNISISSEPGKGSVFCFKVLLEHYEEITLPIDSSNTRVELSSIKVLLAEDNAVNQLVLKNMLIKEGCIVDSVWNGQEAVDTIITSKSVSCNYDLILMDGEMPVMDGLQATQKIREIFDASTLPIIGVTAHAMIEDRERFLQVGMNGYITKPIQKDSLISEIMRCLSKRKWSSSKIEQPSHKKSRHKE